MNLSVPIRPQRRSFNPFALLSDTDFRFMLLIVTAIIASLWYFHQLFAFQGVPVWSQHRDATFYACVEATFGSSAAALFRDPSFNNAVVEEALGRSGAAIDPRYQSFLNTLTPELATRFNNCMESLQKESAGLIVLGAILLLGAAGLIYWFFPTWKIWRDKLVPLSNEDAPEVITYVADLYRETGLSHPPILVWNPLNPASGALVFGRLGRYYLSLTGGLVTQFYTDRPAFRSVLLHELAHLHNADIDKTYFTVAVWLAFVPIVIGSFTIVVFLGTGTVPLGLVTNTGWEIAILAALVYLTRNAVLRSREVYADAQAMVWDGPHGALDRVLARLPGLKGGRWRSRVAVHPDPARRRQILDDPESLFQLGFWDAVGTGVAIAIALPALNLWIGLFQVTLEQRAFATALICTSIGIAILGAGMWRATLVAFMKGRSPYSGYPDRLAVGFALGLLLGDILFFRSRSPLLSVAIGQPIFSLVFTIIVFRWIVASTSAWLEVTLRPRTPRFIYVLGLLIASGLFAMGFGVLLMVSEVVEITGGFRFLLALAPAAVFIGLQHPLVTLLLISLWAFPLAIWFWRRWAMSGVESRQELIDPASNPTQLLTQRPLHLDLALKAGLVGGLVFCILLIAIRVLLRLWLPETIQAMYQYKLALFYGEILVAALLQVGVAAVVASRVRWLGSFQSLFAAFIAGCLMTVGALGINLLIGGTIDVSFTWLTFSQISNWGAVLSLPVAASIFAYTSHLRGSSI